MIFHQYRQLLEELTLREIKARYKQSVLGYAWVILNPFFQMLVMAFVYSQVLRIPSQGVPYSIFLYVGLLPWLLFSNSLTAAANILVSNSSLLKKIYFPRQVFILSTILAKIVDFCLASLILIIFMIGYQIPLSWQMLWFLPIFFIQQLFTYGLSLLLAAFNLFYRDIQFILNLVILIWMYLTPVIYSVEMFPARYQWLFKLNPMSVLINAYRQVLLNGQAPNLASLGVAFITSLLIWRLADRLFKKLEGTFADVV